MHDLEDWVVESAELEYELADQDFERFEMAVDLG
jgi:hypothetical protein